MNTLAPLPEQPLVSVILPVFNGAPYLAESIGSILDQTYDHFELIIVDDGSTDGSAGIIESFARRESRIRPLFLPHGGIARALNTAVREVRGELIARMDADDISLPQRFAVQIDWLRQTGVDLCGCYAEVFGTKNQVWRFPEHPDAFKHELLFRCAVLHPTYMGHSRVLKEHSYAEQTTFEDYELLTRLAFHFRIGNVPQVLLRYRSHDAQIHLVRFDSIMSDLNIFRQRYFKQLFPNAASHDADSMNLLLSGAAFPRADQLETAGTWLARFGRTQDSVSRENMAQRWLTACRNSASLGPRCFSIYRRIAREFAHAGSRRPVSPWSEFGLWSSCTLPAPIDSGVQRVLEFFN